MCSLFRFWFSCRNANLQLHLQQKQKRLFDGKKKNRRLHYISLSNHPLPQQKRKLKLNWHFKRTRYSHKHTHKNELICEWQEGKSWRSSEHQTMRYRSTRMKIQLIFLIQFQHSQSMDTQITVRMNVFRSACDIFIQKIVPNQSKHKVLNDIILFFFCLRMKWIQNV